MKSYGNLRKNVSAGNLDELMFRMRCTVDTLKAVQVAMVEGPDEADNYTDALFGVLISFWDLVEKFSDEIYEVKAND